MHKTKGITLLVEALSDLSVDLHGSMLLLVGPDGGNRSLLVKALRIQDKVLFTGFLNNDEKKMAFVDADVFVTP